MESNRQLLDSLTSHISLYNSHKPSSPNPNPNPRSQILKWFNSLTIRQRQSHLTIVDKPFTQLLIQLQSKLTINGHGLFIVLPDIPSSNPSIPSFCFRKAHGLLTRITNLEEGQVGQRWIGESVQLFCSGENLDCLDSVTVSYKFVEDVGKFVEAMDAVSNGEFLRGEESVVLGRMDWVELGWLKEKGYYSVEAFVANRLELALRLSWLNLNVGKKRGVSVKVKEKAGCAVAGVAANVYWRKMGCVDWWMQLDDLTKKKVFRTVLGKAAKSLTHDILYGRSSGMEDELQSTRQPSRYNHPSWHQEPIDSLKGKDFESGTALFIPPSKKLSSIAHKFNRLLVVCEISTLLLAFDHGQFNEEALFFSSLESVSTTSDRVLRRLRGLLMGVSLEFTKLELLEDLNSTKPVKKSKPKPKPKKGKSRDMKKAVPVQVSEKSSSASDKPTKGMFQDEGDKSDIQEMDYKRDESASTSVEMEHVDEVINTPVQTTSKKSKRARKKHKKDGVNNQLNNTISQTTPVKVSMHPDTKTVPDSASVDNNPVEANGNASTFKNNTESQHVDPIVHEHVKETETHSLEQKPVVVHDGGPMTFSPSGPIASPQLSFVHQSGFVHTVGLCREDDFAVSGLDYSQYFGGGVMYWDSYDHPVPSFSRPPSLSSDDSSWAWQEADMNRTVDDMVAFSSSYSTNGLTSPSATSYTMKDFSEENVSTLSGPLANFPGDIEAKTGDLFPYPILRPIIIPNINRSREFKRNFEHKSPCVPPSRREEPRIKIKRPPSPVVLCVPPVSDSRKQRGFPTVRSGSSSPRQWGVKGWFHGDKKSLSVSARQLSGQLSQTLPGALLQDRLIAISQLTRDQDSHPDLTIPLQSRELPVMHGLLNDEIGSFCKWVAGVNMTRKPYINWAVKRVARSLQVLWPRSRTNVFGSNATGLSLPTSDVDLVVCLPPVRNLEPIKEAGILEGRNGIKETCLQHAARYLANQEWVKNDSLKIVENTAIPIIMLVVEVPCDVIVLVDQEICSRGDDMQSIRIDISFKSPSHTGLQTTELVKELTEQFPAATPLALVLKQFLADRSLDQSYSGGLSSYCLILLITRFLQHEHHYGRSISQNFGGLLMDFLYFFGNVFDPRRMRISVQGSGVYIDRERGYSIDPIYIDDPLFPANNVGRNCFRIHQCIKAFADAYSTLEDQLDSCDSSNGSVSVKLLPLIIPSIAPV